MAKWFGVGGLTRSYKMKKKDKLDNWFNEHVEIIGLPDKTTKKLIKQLKEDIRKGKNES